MTPEAKAIKTLFYIQDKYTQQRVPFIPKPAQLFFDKNETNRMIIAKARQCGFSSWILAKFTIRCLGRYGTRAVIMSHEGEATQKLLNKVDFYLKHMNGPKPQFGRHSRNDIFFSKMDSELYIGTAGSKAFGRGDTISNLHCSEYAFWESPERHHAGAFQAVPSTGQIILESTGNGRSNDFYFIWKNADRMGYTRLFYPWYADSGYSIPHVTSWKPDTPGFNGWLLDIQERHNISANKMAWFEHKFRELREDVRLMCQEYPSSPEDCFQATGGSCFPDVSIQSNPLWEEDVKLFGYRVDKLKNHPIRGFHYVIGADPSGGTGNDDAAIQIFCAETWEQVLSFNNNTIQPIRFGELICQLGVLYNDAYVVVEGNNHGIAVNEYLKMHYKRHLMFKHRLATNLRPAGYGWLNTRQSKHALIDMMKEKIKEVILYGHRTATELQAFEESEEGRLQGASDNLVIAVGLAFLGLERYSQYRNNHLTPHVEDYEDEKARPKGWYYTFDDVFSSLKRGQSPNWFGEIPTKGRGLNWGCRYKH